jgi:protein-tyrosine phosphatase
MTHASQIPLDGASNVRDLGWPAGADGIAARPRRVLRSANLDRLSDAGRRDFTELGIGVVIDLRGKAEAAAAPDFAGTTRVHLPIEPTVVAELKALLAAGSLTVDAAVGVMEDTYRRYIVDHVAVFAGIFQHVLDAKRRPVLFHCAAGKDRTGVAAALILTALGVRPSIIMDDYLLSNRLFRPIAGHTTDLPDDIRETIIKVRPSYLEAAFAAMTERWGGPQAYLEQALGLGAGEREAIRAVFAEDAAA